MALLDDKTIEIDATISITETNLIKITEDKLKLVLYEHIEKLRKSKEWLAALSFSVTILLVLLTSNFKDRWGIPSDGWNMLFILAFVGSVIYLIVTIVNCLKYKVSVDSIMIDIKSRKERKN